MVRYFVGKADVNYTIMSTREKAQDSAKNITGAKESKLGLDEVEKACSRKIYSTGMVSVL